MVKVFSWIGLLYLTVSVQVSFCQIITLDARLHHLRNGSVREWAEFPVAAGEKELVIHFEAQANSSEQTLSLRQYDVKQHWKVQINEKEIGSLAADEKDMKVYFKIPPKLIHGGRNALRISCNSGELDDIKVGEVTIDKRELTEVLSETTIEIVTVDQNSGQPIPSRLTILNKNGILQSVAALDETFLAIRPGFVYTGNGKALLTLPAGQYEIFAGRDFEYSIDSADVTVKAGDRVQKNFRITREVDTEGWISCDTHIHTFTYSRHGDASIEERAITLAGEGIELPILTDHNINVDLTQSARDKQVLKYFTPVVGNELTTKIGHFNIFKTAAGTPAIGAQVESWNDVLTNIGDAEDTQAIILNHARDVHNEFRPFGSERHLSHAGTSNDEWKFPANAMEVINSGSQQTDMMQLFYDWFGMLNRGYYLTPVGSSDSHDVSRFIVGQGRTYIKADDRDTGNIDVNQAIKNFCDGRVMVSLGLMTKILVNDAYGPGDVVLNANSVTVTVEVAGPSWTKASRVSLYANGEKIKEETIEPRSVGGSKWNQTWKLPMPKHDIYLVALAEGPGDGIPYWPIAKPYQPISSEWTPKLVGLSGAVWIDGDHNGKRNAAYDYAEEIVSSAKGDVRKIIRELNAFDEAVAMQAATLLWKHGKNLNSRKIQRALTRAATPTKTGFATIAHEISLLKK